MGLSQFFDRTEPLERPREALTDAGLPIGEYRTGEIDDGLGDLTQSQLRERLRAAQRRIDAHALERATFVRHIERLESRAQGIR